MGYGSEAWARFVRQIRQDPEDQQLRTIAADYLIEHEDPRGEFIVLCWRLEAGVPSADYLAIFERHRELEKLAPWESANGLDYRRMTRGFVEDAHVVGAELTKLVTWCRVEPITRLSVGYGVSREQLDLAELAEIRELAVAQDAVPLLASPRLHAVTKLRISGDLGDAVERALASGVLRPHVVGALAMTIPVIATLAKTPVFDELREMPLDGDDVVACFADDGLQRLARIESTRLTPAGFARLGARLDRVASLSYRGNLDGILPIVRAHVTGANLRSLTLEVAERHVAEILELLESHTVAHVTSLELRGIPLPSVVEHALRRLVGRGALKTVTVVARPRERIDIPGVDIVLVA